jgi:hypothetical protein
MWVPSLLWIPRVGPFIAGRTSRAAAAQVMTDSVLSGRIENITLVRAAGYASALSPDAAVVAYGASAVLSAAMGGVMRLVKHVAAMPHGVAADRRRPDASTMNAAEARSALVVRRYLLGQLRMAEAARDNQPQSLG